MPLRRCISGLAVVAAAAIVTACGSSSKGTSANASNVVHTGTAGGAPSLNGKHITYVGTNDAVYNNIACGAKERVQQLGGSFNNVGGQEFSASSLAPYVNSAIASHPDALIVSPTDPVSFYARLKAASASMPIATVLNDLQNRSPITTEVTYDNVAAGRQAAKFIATKAAGRKVKVGAFSFTKGASLAADAEVSGFQQELNKYPNIDYLGVQYAGAQDTIGVTTQKLDAELSANPDLFAVWTHAGDTGSGALAALRQRHSKALLVANYSNTVPAMVTGLRDGAVTASFSFSFRKSGELAVDQLANKLDGRPVQATVTLEPEGYTRSSFSNPAQAADLRPASC